MKTRRNRLVLAAVTVFLGSLFAYVRSDSSRMTYATDPTAEPTSEIGGPTTTNTAVAAYTPTPVATFLFPGRQIPGSSFWNATSTRPPGTPSTTEEPEMTPGAY